MKINEGFIEKFLNGILKRKIDSGMKKIIKDNPQIAKDVKIAHDANERIRQALEKRLKEL